MENTRPTCNKKSTAAIIDPDNVANYTLTSHKTAASAARAPPRAVTRSESADNIDDGHTTASVDAHHAATIATVPPPPTTDENASSVNSDKEAITQIGKHTGNQAHEEGMPVDQFIIFWIS